MVGTAARVVGALGTVPRVWPGETVVCIASGPSLTTDDVEYCRGRAKVLVINTSILLAPWADAFHACDGRVWRWHKEAVQAFGGLKFSLDGAAAEYGAAVLGNGGMWGLSTDPGVICNGRNSGYQAMNIASLLGASRIVLLGYDMQPGPQHESHWHGDHPNKGQPPYNACVAAFRTIAQPLAALGVAVVNCTRRTALDMFPKQPLQETL